MKKTKLLLMSLLLVSIACSALLMAASAVTMQTTITASSLDNVHVDRVDHAVKLLQGGCITINDTVILSAKPGQTATLTNYSLGFPYAFKPALANVYAFNASNPAQAFNVTSDTGLGDKLGFYGATVIFPLPGVQLSNGKSFSFTVVYVFSNTMLSSTTTRPAETPPGEQPRNETVPVFTMGFPVYPSLIMYSPQNATALNITIASPPKLSADASSPPQLVVNPHGSPDTGLILTYATNSLGPFAYNLGWVNYTQASGGAYQLASFDNLNRQLAIDGFGNVIVTDVYGITSQMQQAESGVALALPAGATDVSAFDAQGSPITSGFAGTNSTTVSLSFGFAIQRGQSAQFKLVYQLTGNYLQRVGTDDFILNLPVEKGLDRVANKFSLTVSLPEGASVKEYPTIKYDLQNNALQQNIAYTAYNVSALDNIDLHMSYSYSVFWASFRPTLWMTAFITIGLIIAFFWISPRPAGQPTAGVKVMAKPQSLRALVSSYEDRTKIVLELDSLERQVQKGRIPRRRYKIRKRMLESQMSKLDRDLVDLKQKAKSMGPRYADILKTLEIAEAELEGIEAEERRTAARYRAGAMTLDAYRNLQEQFNKRREKAKTTIDGALLRLSEGMS